METNETDVLVRADDYDSYHGGYELDAPSTERLIEDLADALRTTRAEVERAHVRAMEHAIERNALRATLAERERDTSRLAFRVKMAQEARFCCRDCVQTWLNRDDSEIDTAMSAAPLATAGEGRVMADWKICTDEMPPDTRKVLVRFPLNAIDIAWATRVGEQVVWLGHHGAAYIHPTHWQPLPAPPDEESEG